ncbi:MAG: hypothetical protein M9883_17275, partial [Methylobacteriaceae bacterium]|nr:hypothetical protein [Methylobacteriaceae bacterium]
RGVNMFPTQSMFDFYADGRDRLIRPPIGPVATGGVNIVETPPNNEQPSQQAAKPTNANTGEYHPFIHGLLETLPASGTLWTIDGRAAWLEAAASAFKLIYKGDGKITIAVSGDSTQNGGRRE